MSGTALREGEYLVSYDYGQGGLWAFVRADSADQIRKRWPQLEVYDHRPAIMDDRLFAEVCGRGIRNLDALDADWFAGVASAADSCSHVVTLLGRTGLRYSEGRRSMFVDSEMLARPNGIVVYRKSISRWDPPDESDVPSAGDRARILANLVQALQAQGLDVDVI